MTKIGPSYHSRALQITNFWRNKARWSKKEREEDNIWREKKKGKEMWMGWGEKGRKHSPGHIKDKKRKQTEKHV